MVRVLTVTNWYPPHHYGGYELSCYDVMTRLEARGHDVMVLCGDTRLPSDPAPLDPEHETRVRRRLRLYHDGADILRPPWRERLAIERHNHQALREAIADHQPDVVSIWHLAAVSQGLLQDVVDAGLPMVLAVCDDWLTYGLHLDAWARPFDGNPVRRAGGRVVERVTGLPCVVPDIGPLGSFLFVTQATEATALESARWQPERRTVVWSGIDRTVFLDEAEDDRPWSWRLVTTGRFDPRKGFETAVRALPLLPAEATLAIWGRGGDDERARLRGIAEELGVSDRVRFGTLEREELPQAYRDADVMLFPSTWPEPFGLVPIEAMACRTPVIGTGVGGSAEFLVDEGNCLLVPPGDPDALAAAVRRLEADPSLRRRLVEGGSRTAAELDVEVLADVMEAWHVYEAEGRTGPRPADRPRPGAAAGRQ